MMMAQSVVDVANELVRLVSQGPETDRRPYASDDPALWNRADNALRWSLRAYWRLSCLEHGYDGLLVVLAAERCESLSA